MKIVGYLITILVVLGATTAWAVYSDSDDDARNTDAVENVGDNSGVQPDEDGVFVFTNKMGTVRFMHLAHREATQYGINGKCESCHGDAPTLFPEKFDDSVTVKEQAHATCIACHQASGHAAAPTKCLACHKK